MNINTTIGYKASPEDYPLERIVRRVCAMVSMSEDDRMQTQQGALEQRFSEIVREHSGMITRICYHYSTAKTTIEDLQQDCLINIWRGLPKYRGESALQTWLYRIVINTCITSYRSDGRRPDTEPLENMREEREEDTGHSEENIQRLHDAIARLPLLDRGIIMMWLDERSYDEISEVTGISRSNVGVRIHRIKERMKETLK